MSQIMINNTEKIIFKDRLYKAFDFIHTSGITEKYLTYHHSSTAQGYLKRNCKDHEQEEVMITEYSGKFGEGYILYLPSYLSKRFVYKFYFIYTAEKKNMLINALSIERDELFWQRLSF